MWSPSVRATTSSCPAKFQEVRDFVGIKKYDIYGWTGQICKQCQLSPMLVLSQIT